MAPATDLRVIIKYYSSRILFLIRITIFSCNAFRFEGAFEAKLLLNWILLTFQKQNGNTVGFLTCPQHSES